MTRRLPNAAAVHPLWHAGGTAVRTTRLAHRGDSTKLDRRMRLSAMTSAVEVLDTISNGEMVSYRFEIDV
jgi:hypothetical protein